MQGADKVLLTPAPSTVSSIEQAFPQGTEGFSGP